MSCEALQDAAGLKKYRLATSSGYSAEVRLGRVHSCAQVLSGMARCTSTART